MCIYIYIYTYVCVYINVYITVSDVDLWGIRLKFQDLGCGVEWVLDSDLE